MDIFIGRVAENKYYAKTGYIDVICFQLSSEQGFASKIRKEFNLEDIDKYLIPSYAKGLTGDGLNTCPCRVLSPLGAGENYGMFSLPQVNSVGLVMRIESDNSKYWSSEDRYIWLGGLYGGKMFEEVMTLPNDDTVSEKLVHEDNVYTDENSKAGTSDTITESPYRQEGMFLVKLKTSKTDTDTQNEKNQQHIHYASIPCDDELVMRKSRITLRHNDYDEDDNRVGITDLTFEKPRLQLSRFTQKDHDDSIREEQIEIFDNEKIKLQFLNKDTKVDRWLTIDNDKMELQYDDPEGKKNHTLQFDNTNHSMNFDFKDDDGQIERQIRWDDNDLSVMFDNFGGSQKVKMTFDKNGTMTLETTKDCNVNVKGATTVNVDKDTTVNTKGNTTIKTTGNTNIESTGNCTVKGVNVDVNGTAACTINAPSVTVTGGMLNIKGTVSPSSSGPFCGLPMCPILKVPHAGMMVAGT